jgi:hypothetical protein
MSTTPDTAAPPPRPRQLLLGVLALLAVVLAAVVLTAVSDATWGLVVALVALGCATLLAVLSLVRLAGDEEGAPVPTPARGMVLGLAFAAIVAVAAGVTVVIANASADDSQSGGAATAERTVREFLTDASLDQNGYAACGLLTSPEQARVARAAGHGQVCREALGAAATVGGVASPHGLRDLNLHAVVHGTRAVVTASGAGQVVRFDLVRSTPADSAAFQPPDEPWRIASGAESLVVS